MGTTDDRASFSFFDRAVAQSSGDDALPVCSADLQLFGRDLPHGCLCTDRQPARDRERRDGNP